MERYLMISVAVLSIAAFIPAVVFLFRAIRHFLGMLSEFKSRRHDFAANLVPFLFPLLPQLFTEKGNAHRRGFLANLFWFLCCGGFIAGTQAFLDIGK
jgi:hypothetical protein